MTDVITAQPFSPGPGSGSFALWYNDVKLGDSDVEFILVTFPPGCAGLVGCRIEYAHNPVYPIGSNEWFIFDDYTFRIDVSGQRTGGQWRISGYNTDILPHTIQSYWGWNYLKRTVPELVTPLVSL